MKIKILALFLSSLFAFGALGFSACGSDGKDGKDGLNGINGEDGKDGKDGVGIKDAYINEDGDLIIEFTDGTEKNCGNVREAELNGTQGLYYSEIKQEEEVIGYSVRGLGSASETSIEIPAAYKGKPVKSISERAFFGYKHITSVTIPDTVATIGEEAFSNCGNLESADLGSGVKEISGWAFFECFNLKEITLPQSVETIGESAFTSCYSLEKITLSYGLKEIGDGAFAGCSGLESFIMPDSVDVLGWGALMSCSALTNLKISNNLLEISEYAFSECSALESVSIGEKVQTIRYAAFNKCAQLKKVVFPVSVTEVVSFAFNGCTAIERAYFKGTEKEWKSISIKKNGNDGIRNETQTVTDPDTGEEKEVTVANKNVYFFSATPPATSEGNYWFLEDGEIVEWSN